MLKLTDVAAEKAAMLRDGAGRDDLALRIAVQPGGCAGLRYQLFFDWEEKDGDHSLIQPAGDGSLRVVIDRHSLPYLETATVDYVETIEKIGFVIDNPAAHGTCSCGDSFA